MELEHIVVGYDGSDDADAAVDAALDLARWTNATLHAVAATDPAHETKMRRLLADLPDDLSTTYDSGAHERELLGTVTRRATTAGVDCETHERQGDAASAILDVADDVNADLVVVGSRGLSRGVRHLRGSVSTKVSSHADRSFLVVKRHD